MKKLSWILPLALLLCFTVGCQDKVALAELEAMKAHAEIEEQNKALFLQYYKMWQQGDIEALKEILSPDYIWHQASGQDFSLDETLELVEQQDRMFCYINVEDLWNLRH